MTGTSYLLVPVPLSFSVSRFAVALSVRFLCAVDLSATTDLRLPGYEAARSAHGAASAAHLGSLARPGKLFVAAGFQGRQARCQADLPWSVRMAACPANGDVGIVRVSMLSSHLPPRSCAGFCPWRPAVVCLVCITKPIIVDTKPRDTTILDIS